MMLIIYAQAADKNIALAEKLVADALHIKEAVEDSMERSRILSLELARFLDSGTVGKYHAEEQSPPGSRGR